MFITKLYLGISLKNNETFQNQKYCAIHLDTHVYFPSKIDHIGILVPLIIFCYKHLENHARSITTALNG